MMILKSSMIAQIGQITLSLQIFLSLALSVIENHPGVASKSQIYVVASNDSQCHPAITNSKCHTLNWYTQHKNMSFKSNTMLIFLEGKHFLDSFIEVSSCTNFTMTANKSTIPYFSDRSLPQPASWIFCRRESRSGFFFMNSSNIRLTGLGLDSCSGVVTISSTLNVYAALAFSQVNHIALSQVVVNNTKGFGLYCSSVFGQINVKESVFLNAKGTDDSEICSGNAQFWFGSPCYNGNTNLIIDHSWFMYGNNTANKFCNASGLQIVIGCPKINTTMNAISVIGNKGINGGNVGLSLTDYGSDTGKITIRNCNISNGWAIEGGGIRFCHCIDFIGSDSISKSIPILTISNSSFSNNMANTSAGGAVFITLHDAKNHLSIQSRQVHVTDSIFIGNKGALGVLKLSVPGYRSFQFIIYFNRCIFQSNQVPSGRVTSIVELIRIENVTLADCTFADSYGSAIYLQSSYLHFFGTIRFESNHGAYGGALHVRDGSLIYLHKLSNILFINNSAHMGGAVYSQDRCIDTIPPCLFQQVSSALENVYDQTAVRFVNNSAMQAGDAIYGGSIDYCFSLTSLSCDEIYARPLNDTLNIIDVSEQSGSSIISSHPHRVCFCDRDIVCNQFTSNVSTFPGGKFNATVAIIGQLNGTTVGEISMFIVDADPTYNSVTRVKNHKEQTDNDHCFILAYKVFSNETAVKLSLNAVLPTGMLNTCFDPIEASMAVTLQPCPYGFVLTDTPPYFCDCSPLFRELLVQCDIDTQLIQIYLSASSSAWFGCDSLHNINNTIICYLSEAWDCYLYCNQKDHYVNITSSIVYDDQQCIPGRTGILCGACKPGLSQVLGSLTKCQKCSNKNLLFLIPLMFLSGWVIIIFLTSLNMTVTEGKINGLVLYGNTMYAYQKMIHNPSPNVFKKICWTFIALLNFDIGTETCFYDGMDNYHKLWIFYGYIFYLITLQIIIVLLCRRFVTCTRLFRKNVLQVLATILFVMCAPVVDTIVHTFAKTTLQVYDMTSAESKKSTVWILDGNLTYLGAKHSILFMVGIVYCIGVSFFTFSLLLNQCLQRRSNLFCFRWVERWRPFFEAYTGPCNNNFRFWPGFLIFMQLVLNVFNNNRPSSVISSNITVFSVIIISLSCIFPRGIYKKWSLNVLEFSFFLNLCITSVIWSAVKEIYHDPLFNLSVSIAMLTFLGIIIYHIIVRVKNRQPICERILCLSKKIPCKHQILLCCHCNESEENDETAPLLPQPLAPCVQREPLL